MRHLTIREILNATDGKLIAGDENAVIKDIKQDSRICESGDMFVAFLGSVQDGHKFVKNVLAGECETVFIHDDSCLPENYNGKNIILVSDTTYQLGQLAAWYLDSLNVRKVAVTGSVGKTSARDLIHSVLSQKYVTGKNIKNYNNAWGLPLSIFQLNQDTEAVVLEIGMNHLGEIDRLAEIIKPEIGVITNIGVSHIENLGSQEGIFNAKMEMTKHIKPGGSLVYVADDKFLTKERTAGAYNLVSIGGDGEDYAISSVDDFGIEGIQFNVDHKGESNQITMPLAGVHNCINAGIAIAVGQLLGISIDEAKEGLLKAQLTGSRLKIIKAPNGCTIIDDTYNAATDSMKSAIDVLEASRCRGKKIAILGEMYEMGQESSIQHERVGNHIKEKEIDLLIALGNLTKPMAKGAEGGKAQIKWFETKEEVYDKLDDLIGQGDIVLVKASRGMQLENIVQKISEL